MLSSKKGLNWINLLSNSNSSNLNNCIDDFQSHPFQDEKVPVYDVVSAIWCRNEPVWITQDQSECAALAANGSFLSECPYSAKLRKTPKSVSAERAG